MILPWCILTSLSLIMLLLLKLLPLKELSTFAVNVISVLLGAPLGLYVAHWVCIFDCLEPVVRKVNSAIHRDVVIFFKFLNMLSNWYFLIYLVLCRSCLILNYPRQACQSLTWCLPQSSLTLCCCPSKDQISIQARRCKFELFVTWF